MLSELLCIYSSILTSVVAITIAFIILGKSWGDLPKIYASFVIYLQENLGVKLNEETQAGKRLQIIQRRHHGRFIDSIASSYCHSKKVVIDNNNAIEVADDEASFELFEIQAEMFQAGIESIIQDDLMFTCDFSPINHWSFLSSPSFTIRFGTEAAYQWLVYSCGWILRFLFLLPVRCCLLLASIAFLTAAAVGSFVHKYTHGEVVYIGRAFSRLFCASTGVIGNFIDRDTNQPKAPGIVVSNHISANDIQLLFSDTQEWGFTVTGQKHKGIIGWVEKTAGQIGSTLWLERTNANERRDFQKEIINNASDETKDPILLFPEGYCSNGTGVSQFRRACFVENIDFYPVSISQDPRLGDGFWKEDTFLPYLFRLMTSFGIIYNVRYLPPMRRESHETSEEFARRLQHKIADASDIDTVPFDLSVLKRVSEQKRIHAYSQSQCAHILTALSEAKFGPMILCRG